MQKFKTKAFLKEIKNNELTFKIDDFLPDVKTNEYYRLEISDYKSSRSLDQNSMLWGIIQSISKETDNEPMDIYISALEKANAKYEWIAGLESIEDELKKCFRAVKPYGTVTTENGKELIRYKVFYGSSKFDTAEMKKLIDYVIDIAIELGVEVGKDIY